MLNLNINHLFVKVVRETIIEHVDSDVQNMKKLCTDYSCKDFAHYCSILNNK